MMAQNKPTAQTTGKEVAQFEFDRNTGLTSRMAVKFGIEPAMFLTTLKQTAFRQRGKAGAPPVEVSNEQMAMLLHIAEKYDLDPFARQLYAFPQDGGIVPIVPIDGWIAIINRHPQFESMEIVIPEGVTDPDEYWTEAIIQRKDRKKPTKIREWLKECYRKTEPWDEMPKRMLRHKAIIQSARVAFGYSGIFDPDEAERIFANAIDVTPPKAGKPATREPQAKAIDVADPSDTKGPRITVDQVTAIADKLKEEGIASSRFLAEFEIGAIEEIAASDYGAAMRTIDDLSAETE